MRRSRGGSIAAIRVRASSSSCAPTTRTCFARCASSPSGAKRAPTRRKRSRRGTKESSCGARTSANGSCQLRGTGRRAKAASRDTRSEASSAVLARTSSASVSNSDRAGPTSARGGASRSHSTAVSSAAVRARCTPGTRTSAARSRSSPTAAPDLLARVSSCTKRMSVVGSLSKIRVEEAA